MEPIRHPPTRICHFARLTGELDASTSRPGSAINWVVLSEIARGETQTAPRSSLGLAYVAEGTEIYRIFGRTYTVEAGNFVLLPKGSEGTVAVDGRSGIAKGMCISFAADSGTACPQGDDADLLQEPLAFTIEAGPGSLIRDAYRRMLAEPECASDVAETIVEHLQYRLSPFVSDVVRRIDDIGAVKPSTRYEIFRRLSYARDYLHEVDHRRVELSELAAISNVSNFHLARLFTKLFGAPPSAFHRRSRLERARDDIARGRLNCTEAAFRYGFGEVAHFSRAYRSAFGYPPSLERQRN